MGVKTLAAVAVMGGLVGGGTVLALAPLVAPGGASGDGVRAYLLGHPDVVPEAMQRRPDC